MAERPPVDADVADLRERVARTENKVDAIYDILREHVVERKENSIHADIERKAQAASVHEELKAAADVTNAALAAIKLQVSAVDVRVATVEADIRDFRVGWKVLGAAGALMASLAGIAGAFAAKWFGWRY